MDVNSNLGMQRLEELAASADAVRVPHRQNRFVIFDSELIHESDTFTFKPGCVAHVVLCAVCFVLSALVEPLNI